MRFIGIVLFGLLLTNTANATEYLSATIVGSGSPIYNKDRASASVLVSAGDTKILVDMGNGAQANLNKLGVNIKKLSALFFTHHHLDHNEEFPPLLIRSLLGRHNFAIIGPPNTSKFTSSNLDLYAEDISYRLGKTKRTLADRQKAFSVKDIQGGESFTVGNIRISTLKVPHTIHTIAYRFDYNGQSIVITGDLTYSQDLPEFAKNADYLIIDSGGMVMSGGKSKRRRKNNNKKAQRKKLAKGNNKRARTKAHLNLAESSLIAKKAAVKNIVYTHFTTGKVEEEASLQEIHKNYKGNVIFGEDLMVVKCATNNQSSALPKTTKSYTIVDTGQKNFYSDNKQISPPSKDDKYFGQDGSYLTHQPSYTDNNNGTITDNVTGLTWQKTMGSKLSYAEAMQKVKSINFGGYNDWRVPTIKELYSLIQFTGSVKGQKAINPFIDTEYFTQQIGNSSKGEREIDAQTWSRTEYVGKTMKNNETVFGVNFVDGRIKGYPKYNPRTRQPNKMYFRFVRGNSAYGKNDFTNTNRGTIVDNATGLMWQQSDSLKGMNWEDALSYAENLKLGGYDDWRLPNAKELQSILDYTRSPDTTGGPAINPIFKTSSISNEAMEKDYPYYWTSTTHLDGRTPEKNAAYISFGRALGKMRGDIMDVHGAGSQRSDPKTGSPTSKGPQGDLIRVENYVRVVRGGAAKIAINASKENISQYDSKNEQLDTDTKSSSPSWASKFIARADRNNDGKVSKSEFKGPSQHFSRFDKNNDGYITEDEAPQRSNTDRRKSRRN